MEANRDFHSLVIGLSTAMYSGIHLCTQVGVIVTRMPLCSATVILINFIFQSLIVETGTQSCDSAYC